ncbi:hypothetical protein [Acidianus sp. HS-5]|uniref:hypothetical protein n=1 Tax=Acidianus sp. HS-5 TaxID=2886040 RepID=UPI001F4820F2|nr:hypothetical protein [Acidianus sp. HS-5]BDC17821.1 hypothetical protein HS5_07110 [Acidianus sp. HS-5]
MREAFLILGNDLLRIVCNFNECEWFILDQNCSLDIVNIKRKGKVRISGNAENLQVFKIILSFILSGKDPNDAVCIQKSERTECIKGDEGIGIMEGKWSGRIFFNEEELENFLRTLNKKE